MIIAIVFSLGYIAVGFACGMLGLTATQGGIIIALHLAVSVALIWTTYRLVSRSYEEESNPDNVRADQILDYYAMAREMNSRPASKVPPCAGHAVEQEKAERESSV